MPFIWGLLDMGISGTTCPKFQYLPDADPLMVVFPLPYGRLMRSEPTTDYVEHKSQLDGAKEFVPRGTHWVIEIKYHLYKHTTAPTSMDQYNAICVYKSKEVYLYLHSDGAPFYTATGYVKALFVLKEIIPYELTTAGHEDALTLIFESVDTILQGNPS
jgi:hypothetical protein